jgi:hypothetical protein
MLFGLVLNLRYTLEIPIFRSILCLGRLLASVVKRYQSDSHYLGRITRFSSLSLFLGAKSLSRSIQQPSQIPHVHLFPHQRPTSAKHNGSVGTPIHLTSVVRSCTSLWS